MKCKYATIGDENFCKTEYPCWSDEGDCDTDDECQDGLLCGSNNCPDSLGFHSEFDCCYDPSFEWVTGESRNDPDKCWDHCLQWRNWEISIVWRQGSCGCVHKNYVETCQLGTDGYWEYYAAKPSSSKSGNS